MATRKKEININLVIKDDLSGEFLGQFLSWALTYGRYIIIITQIIVLSVFFLRFKLDRDHTDLKEAASQKQAILLSISDVEKEIRRVQSKLLHIRETTTNQDVFIRLLDYLEDNTPTDTTFSSLAISDKDIRFSATSESLRSFSFFLLKLQEDQKFSEVSLEDIKRLADGKINFRISVGYNLSNLIKTQP